MSARVLSMIHHSSGVVNIDLANSLLSFNQSIHYITALVFLDKNRMTGDSSPICVGAPAISFMATDCKNEVTCACCDLCCNDNDASCNDAEVAANLDDGYERSQYVFSEDLVFYKDLDPSA